MSDYILHLAPPSQQSNAGPWAPAALTRRALADLATIAETMHGRQCNPAEILLALYGQSALRRQLGAELPADAALTILRQLPELSAYDPATDYRERWGTRGDELTPGIDPISPAWAAREWEAYQLRQRCYALAAWLLRYAGSASAEAAVRAVEYGIVSHLGDRS